MTKNILCALSVYLLLLSASVAEGQAKKAKLPKYYLVQSYELFDETISVKDPKKPKKSKSVPIQCRDTVAGTAKNGRDGLQFTPFSLQIKLLKKAKRPNSAKIRFISQLNREATKRCKNPTAGSLAKYTGTFGPVEARTLYDRFAFGATEGEIKAAVAAGLDATVSKLTTYVNTPQVDAVEASLRCDGRLPDDPDKEICDPQNINDLSLEGLRYGIYYRILNAPNRFFDKMFMFLHDERLAVSSDVLDGCERHAAIKYVDKVRASARSGSYLNYLRDLNNDHLAHLKWLSGSSNRYIGPGSMPNENYGREFLELATIGPNALDGSPNYNDFDIAQSALVFTGNTIEGYSINDNWVCLASYVPGLHAPGSFTLFYGTPYQVTASTPDQLLNGIAAHPRLAEHLAEDIWKQFVGTSPNANNVKMLAKTIRDNNYNLIPVLRTLMSSKAIFAPENRKALIKHPMELLFGFLISTGVPAKLYEIDDWLRSLGQRPLKAPTVFGWNEHNLAGEAFVVAWRNVATKVVNKSNEWLEEQNYSFYDRFLKSFPTGAKHSTVAIQRAAAALSTPLNPDQVQVMESYMDYNLVECGNPAECGGNEYKLVPVGFFADPESPSLYKFRGALIALATIDQYRMK